MQLHNGLLLKDCPADGSGYVLIQDTAKAGEVRTYLARFYGTTKVGAAKWADMPVHLLVLWDDALTQAEHMDVPVRATEEGTCLPLSIRVPSHLSPGKHSLTVMAYPYPHYLRFWRSGNESRPWVPNAMYCGYLLARVSVTVST